MNDTMPRLYGVIKYVALVSLVLAFVGLAAFADTTKDNSVRVFSVDVFVSVHSPPDAVTPFRARVRESHRVTFQSLARGLTIQTEKIDQLLQTNFFGGPPRKIYRVEHPAFIGVNSKSKTSMGVNLTGTYVAFNLRRFGLNRSVQLRNRDRPVARE